MENENEPNTDGGALRKQLEKALADNKAMAERMAAMEARERTQSVEKALSEKGLNPKLAKFVSAEDGADPAKLDAWIKDNAELFGSTNVQEGGSEDPGAPNVDPETARSYTRIQQVSQNGAHSVSDMSALEAQIKQAKNPAELKAIFAKLGN